MQGTWYGQYSLPVNAAGFWQVGPYHLWVHRATSEWRVASTRGKNSLERSLLIEVPSGRLDPPDGATVRRFGFQHSPEVVNLTPALADRPVVISPEETLLLPPQETITVFVSTPAWVEVTFGDAPDVLLDEATHRPTDTWFGSSPMRGELCYATRTAARMNLDNVPSRHHRVISVVEIRNTARATLTVEKLKIPAPHQSVYADEDGSLWTETVTLEHREEGALAMVGLGKGPPSNTTDAVLVRGPRSPIEAGLLTRAFGGFVS